MKLFNVNKHRFTHGQRLVRWLGHEKTEHISKLMAKWPSGSPPIAIGGVPGKVYAIGGGEFVGPIDAGFHGSVWDFCSDKLRRFYTRMHKMNRRFSYAGAGFASLSDLIAEASAGKKRTFIFQKVGTTGVTSVTNSLWRVGNTPPAAANASAAPGGDAPTDATTGAFPFSNPTGGDTQHYVGANVACEDSNATLMLYDRIFQVNKTMSSTATEAVTGVPTRYQNVAGNPDYAGGNFLFVEVGAALGATAHNWTVCQYTDQDGNTGATLPSITGNTSAIINRLDHPTMEWFAAFASGDTGIKALTQMQCSASVTGTINFVIGHPIAWMPIYVANMMCIYNGILTAFNLERIFDDAALALLEPMKPGSGTSTYTGTFQTVSG